MPSAVRELQPYVHVPETKEQLDWAQLTQLDLSKYGTPEGNAELAQVLINAIRTKGFFYVTNFGISQEDVDQQFALGQAFFNLPLEERRQYAADLKAGNYTGYLPAGRHKLAGGVPEKMEMWNTSTTGGEVTQPLPDLLDAYRGETKTFSKDLHKKILDPLNHLLAIALEVPEDLIKNLHRWDADSESHLRHMKYGKFSPEELKTLEGDMWVQGHTDLGSWTLLFRQPVAGLQIRDQETNEWKWAKPLDASLTVNAGDALSYLTGGYAKSTIHRVAVPPKDQQNVDRLGVLYFSRPDSHVPLRTIDSPVLQKTGHGQNDFEAGGHPAPTMGEFTKIKQTWNQSRLGAYGEAVGKQILPGVVQKAYA